MSDAINPKMVDRQRFGQARRQAACTKMTARLTGEDIHTADSALPSEESADLANGQPQ